MIWKIILIILGGGSVLLAVLSVQSKVKLQLKKNLCL